MKKSLLAIIGILCTCFLFLFSCKEDNLGNTSLSAPQDVICSSNVDSLLISNLVSFSVTPVENATSYIWKTEGPAAWIINEKTASIVTKLPSTAGTYIISVAACNDKVISEYFSLTLKIHSEISNPGDVPNEVFQKISEPDVFQEKEEKMLSVETLDSTRYTLKEEIEGVIYNTEWLCEKKRYSASENPDNFVMFDPLASVLWPGNLVQGNSIASGVPTSIPISKRKPGNISFAIVSPDKEGTVNKYYRTVEKMQFSYVNQAMNEVLSGYGGNGYAKYNFDMDFIESASDLNFKLKAGFSGGIAKMDSKFQIDWSVKKTRILVKLSQQYYTMVYDDPDGISGVFTPNITVNDVINYTGNGNPMCYISSVTYGRIYFLIYESTASKKDLDAALSASFLSGKTETEAKFNDVMNQTKVRVFQLGGNAADGLNSVTATNFNAIQDFLNKGANFSSKSPGAPISYTIKYLKNAKQVRMNNTMEYTVENCEPIKTDPQSTIFDILIKDYDTSFYYSLGKGTHFNAIGIEIGYLKPTTGENTILSRNPKNATYGEYLFCIPNMAVNFSSRVIVPKDCKLYLQFKVQMLASDNLFYDRYERTVYFIYDNKNNRWIPENGDLTLLSKVVVQPTNFIFGVTNEFHYSISYQK